LVSVRQSVPKVEDASGQQAPNQLTQRAILDRYQPAEIHCVSRSYLNWSSDMSAWTTFPQRQAPDRSHTWAGPGRGFDHRSAFREPFVLIGGRRSRWSSFLKFADLAGEPWACLNSVPGRRIAGSVSRQQCRSASSGHDHNVGPAYAALVSSGHYLGLLPWSSVRDTRMGLKAVKTRA
jgi:hypothetical protein